MQSKEYLKEEIKMGGPGSGRKKEGRQHNDLVSHKGSQWRVIGSKKVGKGRKYDLATVINGRTVIKQGVSGKIMRGKK